MTTATAARNFECMVLTFESSENTDALLEGMAKHFKYEAFATRFLAHLNKRKADREAAEVRAKTLDQCVEKLEKVLGRTVVV